jgi:hypothetical protein
VETTVRNDAREPLEQPVVPLRLQIAGADLLLSGRFEHWMPVLLSEGNEKEPATVQLLVDVTSNRSRHQGKDLLTFKTRSVQASGPQTYRLKGTLQADGQSREVEAVLRNPPGHTPFFLLLLHIDQASFPGLWEAIEERAVRVQDSGQEELRPRAWLRAPELAAA